MERIREDLLYQLALTSVPHIGPVQAKILLQHLNAPEIFRAKKSWLEKIEGIGPIRASAITGFRDFRTCEKEILFIEKYGVKPLFITDPAYPKRLLNCYDSPTLLFYKGHADLNASRIVAVIGTRSHTTYGKQVTEKLVAELAEHHIIVVSGLAYGIDAIAHQAAIRQRMPTVAVLAHGLDLIYPPEHSGLAKEIVRENGGLLTEFRSGSNPDKHNFPSRNRIVAGMCDATVVIETGIKGGSMITADLANGYNRDVFAIPGRSNDPKSAGCNHLIQNNKAILLTGAKDLLNMLDWDDKRPGPVKKRQKELFLELSVNEQAIVNILGDAESVHIDEIKQKCGLSNSVIAEAILNLEIRSAILSLPGKLYRLT